jgi:uncharacterized protein YggE
MKLRYVHWMIALVLFASAFAGVGAPRLLKAEDAASSSRTISVLGNGVVETKPDTATVSFGVTTQATTAKEAISSTSSAMEKVLDALKGAGIDSKDLQTEFVSVYPRTDDTGQDIVGYTASNSVSATVRDLARVGALIDTGVGAGANTVSGPSLAREDQDKLYRDALKEAVADARAKANALADAAGVSLGDVKAIVEAPDTASSPLESFASLAKDSSGGAPIEPGTAKISANVRVIFDAG